MKRLIALLAVMTLIAGCGGTEARSGGPLTIAVHATTVPTASPGVDETTPQATLPDSTPTTTLGSPSTTVADGSGASSSTVVVYLLDDSGQAVAVERTVNAPGVARAAIEALIAGPNSSEAAAGLATAFPPDSLVLGLTIGDGTAVADMSVEFEAGGGSAAILGRLAQLVYTLTEFDSVDRVRLLLEGRSVEYFSGEGIFVGAPISRADFSGSVPIGPERTSAIPTWAQSDLPAVEPGDDDVYRVVLVASDDFLNVRAEAGVDGATIGRLLPGVGVRTTDDTETVGSSTWRKIVTPAGEGWVNGFYLTRSVDPRSLPAGADPESTVGELAERMESGRDFTDLVSEKGLWVAHHESPVRFRLAEIAGLLDDPTTYRWGSNALEPSSPEIQPRTFAVAVAERFVGAYDDPDRRLLVDQVLEGPNGRPPEFALPTEFDGFPYVTVYDSGDDPQYGGLDWTSWIVSLAYEDGDLKVVGLTIDEWAP